MAWGRKALQIIDVIAKARVGGRGRKALRFIDEIMPTSDLGLGGGGGGGWMGVWGSRRKTPKAISPSSLGGCPDKESQEEKDNRLTNQINTG